MSDIRTRLAAWYLGQQVEPEATRWADQVISALEDLGIVAIWPEDREQVERLALALRDAGSTPGVHVLADALRSLIAPPRPPEPMGLGAAAVDGDGRKYVRIPNPDLPGDKDVWFDHQGDFHSFADIQGVRVLSEGVTE